MLAFNPIVKHPMWKGRTLDNRDGTRDRAALDKVSCYRLQLARSRADHLVPPAAQ